MSQWNVEIARERMVFKKGTGAEDARYDSEPCAPFCKLHSDGGVLDADNLRILIDSLHAALDIIAPNALLPKEMP